MQAYLCPSCGAEVPFQSSVAVFAVCRSCGAMVVRTDEAVQALGMSAALPEEASPLQIGAGLHWGGRAYTVLGRARMAWADGAWNEWFLAGEAGTGWLAEAQGSLVVSFEREIPPDFPTGSLSLGSVVSIDGKDYRVADIKQARCVGSEGELPFAAPRGRAASYVDMLSASAGFAGLEASEDQRRLYVGAYVSFEALGLTNLRQVEGWPRPDPKADRSMDPRLP